MDHEQKRAVIVDDHPAFRTSARLLLESEGYEVVGEAGDGAAALHLVGDVAPDLVLLDLQLPDVDGFEVAERIGDGPAIVLVSSRDRSDLGPLAESSTVRGFISKSELTGEALAELLR